MRGVCPHMNLHIAIAPSDLVQAGIGDVTHTRAAEGQRLCLTPNHVEHTPVGDHHHMLPWVLICLLQQGSHHTGMERTRGFGPLHGFVSIEGQPLLPSFWVLHTNVWAAQTFKDTKALFT